MPILRSSAAICWDTADGVYDSSPAAPVAAAVVRIPLLVGQGLRYLAASVILLLVLQATGALRGARPRVVDLPRIALLGAVAALLINGPSGFAQVVRPPDALPALGYLAIMVSVGANLAWYTALPRLGPDRAGLFYAFTPVAH